MAQRGFKRQSDETYEVSDLAGAINYPAPATTPLPTCLGYGRRS
jgi:hypothetical protein